MNAVRHGLHARTVILRGETQADFDEIFNGLQDEYQPQSDSEQILVIRAAMALWKLVRAEIHVADACNAAKTAEERVAIFCKMTLATGRLDRVYLKTYKELERIKAAREPQPDPDPPHEPKVELKEKPPNGNKEDDENPRQPGRLLGRPRNRRAPIPLPPQGQPMPAPRPIPRCPESPSRRVAPSPRPRVLTIAPTALN